MPRGKPSFLFVLWLLCTLVLSVRVSAMTPGTGGEPFTVRSWTVEDGLPQHSVLSILQDRTGYIWLGTRAGLARFDGVTFRVFNRWNTAHLKGDTVRAIYQDRNGVLWFGADGGLSCLEAGGWSSYTTNSGLSHNDIRAIREDGAGNLWVGTANGLNRLEAGEFRTFAGVGEPWADTVTTLAPLPGGGLYGGTGTGGLYRLNNGGDAPLKHASPPLTHPINALCGDGAGGLWIGTEKGLYRLTGGAVSAAVTDHPLARNSIRSLMKDRKGSVWIGTDGEGLYCYKNGRFRAVPLPPGLADDFIYALMEDREDNLWLGAYSSGLVRLTPPRVRHLPISAHPEPTGPAADGLNRFPDGRFAHVDAASLHIRTTVKDHRGRWWIGTRTGVKLVTGDRLEDLDPVDGKPFEADVSALYADGRGKLWIGADGLTCWNPEEKTLTRFTPDHGLPFTVISAILEDATGNLWFATASGIYRVPLGQLEAVVRGERQTVDALILDEHDGMRSRECVAGARPAAWKRADGALCFSTLKGPVLVDPAAFPGNTLPPAVVLEEVLVDNEPPPPDLRSHRRFPHTTRVVAFRFTALSFTAPGKVKLRYKLDGSDDHWRETAPRRPRTASYWNLAPGSYRFQVIACNNDGVWNTTGAVFDFSISAPFTQTALFYLLLSALLAAAAGGVILYRKRTRAADVSPETKPEEKYKTSALLQETVDAVLPRLKLLMEEEKVYLEADLTLKKLAGRLNVHYNHLSQIINERMGCSFNDYVNGFRIEAAKRRLTDPKSAKLTVLEIAYETGFYSKSVFNTAFKKFTGLTPSQYRRDQ